MKSKATCRRSRWLFFYAKRDVGLASGTRNPPLLHGDQQRAEMHPHGDSGGAWQAKVCAFRLCRGRKKHLKA